MEEPTQEPRATPPEFLRTCQECNHQQADVDPTTLSTSAFEHEYCERRCKRCGSPGSLNYGSPNV